MPIGNLTSQIFANIYLNELDRFVKHTLKVKNYLRYGDDFILVHHDLQRLTEMQALVTHFLADHLRLEINPKHDRIIKVQQGLRFLGVVIYPKGRKLMKRNESRIDQRLGLKNASSYFGLVKKYGNKKMMKRLMWKISDLTFPPQTYTLGTRLVI